MVNGTSYQITFYSYYNSYCTGNAYLRIGASTVNNTFGDEIYSVASGNEDTWMERTFYFTASNNTSFITVQVDVSDPSVWYQVDNFSIEVFTPPSPTITTQPINQTNICYGSSAYFFIEGENIDTYQWQESTNDGATWSDISDGGFYSGSSTYSLTITADISLDNNQYSCTISNTAENVSSDAAILTIETENPVITSTHNDQQIDANENCEVSLPDYTGDVTATDNCDDNLDVTQMPTAGTTIFGITNEITLIVTDDAGNYAEVLFNVEVVDNTDPETPTLTDLTDQCSVTAIAPTTTDNCAGTVTGTTTDPTEYSEQGTYVITWNFVDGNGNDINVNQNVIIDDITNPIITCIENQTKQLSEGETFYTVSGIEFNPTENSDNCDGYSIANDFNDLSTLENAEFQIGLTTVTWTITDIANNETQCSFDVQVNAFVGIETLQQNGISIYPNPTNGIVNFEFANDNIQQIKISDLTGKTIIEKVNIQQNETIDLSSFESGIYIIKIQTDNEIFTTKIVKE